MPAKADKRHDSGVVSASSSYKQQQEEKRRKANNTWSWNSLFLRQDAVADAMADALGVTKGDIFDRDADSMAVRLALGETQVVAENKAFLAAEGVNLAAFGSDSTRSRSDTILLVKNLPFGATEEELRAMFVKFGSIDRLVLPPSNTMALIQFLEATEARQAFRGLSYRKYASSSPPLILLLLLQPSSFPPPPPSHQAFFAYILPPLSCLLHRRPFAPPPPGPGTRMNPCPSSGHQREPFRSAALPWHRAQEQLQ